MSRDPDPRPAFDAAASSYDRQYRENPSMLLMRRRVWRRLDDWIEPGASILELGCGTGLDTAHLAARGCRVLASDCSPEMLGETRRRVDQAGFGAQVKMRRLDMARPDELAALEGDPFDGVLADFGGLNTVADLPALAEPLLRLIRPGGWFIAGVMGRHCLWDWGIELVRGNWRGLRTRRTRGGTTLTVGGHPVRCYFPTPAEFRRAFPRLQTVSCEALGLLLPPPRVTAGREGWRLWERLDRWEEPWARLPPFRGLGDHFLAIMRRP